MPDQSTEASTFPLPPATPPSVPPSYSTLPRPFLIRHGQSMGNAVDRKLFAILGTLLSSRSSLRRANYWSPAPCSPTPRVRVKNEPCQVGIAFSRDLSLWRHPTPLHTRISPPTPAVVTEALLLSTLNTMGTKLEPFAGYLETSSLQCIEYWWRWRGI